MFGFLIRWTLQNKTCLTEVDNIRLTILKSRGINIAMDTKTVPSRKDAKMEKNEVLADDCVLIVGGGPVGLFTAAVLAFYGIPSVIIERNSNTTRYGSRSLPGNLNQTIEA